MSSEHACRMTPGSLGSSKSISAALSTLVRAVASSLPNALFQCAVELIATSLNFPEGCLYGRFVTGDRCVASNSAEPAGVIFRNRASSTCCSGRSRILSFRSSGLIVVPDPAESWEDRDGGKPANVAVVGDPFELA